VIFQIIWQSVKVFLFLHSTDLSVRNRINCCMIQVVIPATPMTLMKNCAFIPQMGGGIPDESSTGTKVIF